MEFPKTYGPSEIPASVQTLITVLLPQLLEGAHPALTVLREQLRTAHVKEVEMTGHGFFVDFDIPSGVPLAEPRNFAGGEADITLSSAQYGAGCLVFVREGRLATFEGYTYSETWDVDAQVLAIKTVVPIVPA